jgi:hypothetical protein
MRHRLVRSFTGAFSRRDRDHGMAPSDDAQIDMEQGMMIEVNMAIGVKMVKIANQKPELTNARVELDHW